MKNKSLFTLFTTFFKIGCVAFGGGYAIIPLLQRETVENHQWVSSEELMDMMAISQSLPGIIYVNSATMIGYRLAGTTGAIVATIAGILPTFIITVLIAGLFWGYTDLPFIKKAFTGVLLGVTAMILYALTNLWKSAVRNRIDAVVAIVSAILLVIFKIHAAILIIASGLLYLGYHWFIFKARRK